MYCIKKNIVRSEEEKISSYILNWYESRENLLNVISVPYNGAVIFLKTILRCMQDEKKVLYITQENEGNISILDMLKKSITGKEYEYIRNENTKVPKNLCFCSIDTALFYLKYFDLYIFDDISSFHDEYPGEVIRHILKRINPHAKFLSYTSESIDFFKRELCYPVASHRQPVIEPRTVITRLDINKDIPLEAFEYVKWSLRCRRNIIIYVPDGSTAINVTACLQRYLKGEEVNLNCYIKGKSSMKGALSFMKMKNAIMLTDDCSDIFLNSKDTDIMVFNADSEVFTYKKLLYLSSRAGRRIEKKRGEAVFLAREETSDMEKAKDIARNFNKEAWECGLLKI